ncbi:MAG: NifU N-terminal domain-containing protein [Anaerolineales bacterium]|nr:NifU N-terminal domain-containing protein [Anaerolineales bacterium]
MSEYIDIETELSEDGRHIHVYTNLTLTRRAAETYDSPAALEEGSPLAQALAVIDGITHLHIAGSDLTITYDPDASSWHAIAADVSAAIKDFFL